ncbi:hypothetical protein AGLY_000552 [Aphis glycines]|uniref:Uncharacterized protein n=1 Tax=Aphis glycines TaxID=307491 RepID=A0A6G0U8S4_APHGL|nr:hypothetical protein AGLY_000552 [Aphis glycines]
MRCKTSASKGRYYGHCHENTLRSGCGIKAKCLPSNEHIPAIPSPKFFIDIFYKKKKTKQKQIFQMPINSLKNMPNILKTKYYEFKELVKFSNLNAFFNRLGSSKSGALLPNCPKHWAKAEAPSRALIFSSPTLAAILKESLPPSIAIPKRSTLLVRYLLLPTDGSLKTLSNASITVRLGNIMGTVFFGCHDCLKTLRGTLLKIISKSKFTGYFPFSEIGLSSSFTFPSLVTTPTVFTISTSSLIVNTQYRSYLLPELGMNLLNFHLSQFYKLVLQFSPLVILHMVHLLLDSPLRFNGSVNNHSNFFKSSVDTFLFSPMSMFKTL